MKSIKRVICMVLAVTLLCSSQSAVVFAASMGELSNQEKYVAVQNEIVLSKSDNMETILRIADYDNGDSEFFIVKNGEVISSSYARRSDSTIMSTNYVEKTVSIQTVLPAKELVENEGNTVSLLVTDGFTAAGTAYYTLTYGKEGEYYTMDSDLDIEYKSIPESVNDYDLYGKYKDMASLAAKIALALNVTGIIGGRLAIAVVNVLGLAHDFENQLIPRFEVDADITTNTWQQVGADTGWAIQGKQVIVNLNGEDTVYEKDNDFYPVSMLNTAANRKILGEKLGALYFTGMDEIKYLRWIL